ncbi:MAG: CinA family protein [Eubacteriales bacterium]|nr:CinA family protein [Eubacteriales bacterium]
MSAERLVRLLKEKKETLALAESCTGGLIASTIVDVPGASEVFKGGVVSYTDEIKNRLLGVEKETLARYTAVSEPTAREMALGAARRFGSDWALSVTGYAGPSGIDKRLDGVVYISLTDRNGNCQTRRFRFSGERNETRRRAAQIAIDWLVKAVSGGNENG